MLTALLDRLHEISGLDQAVIIRILVAGELGITLFKKSGDTFNKVVGFPSFIL
jgi:hypothetical protein